MTQEEVESKILKKLKEIKSIMKKYDAECENLYMTIEGNEIYFQNDYYNGDLPICGYDKE